jgi:hypothetical protein
VGVQYQRGQKIKGLEGGQAGVRGDYHVHSNILETSPIAVDLLEIDLTDDNINHVFIEGRGKLTLCLRRCRSAMR